MRGRPFRITGDLVLENKLIESMGNLRSVGGNLNIAFSKINSLENLETIDGDLQMIFSNLKSFGNLKSINGHVFGCPKETKDKLREEKKIKIGGHMF